MKNRILFEKIVQSIAPAVTKYHLDLQLKSKGKSESEFALHRETPRYIAEDCADIAKAILNELEHTRDKSKKGIVSKIMETISTAPVEKEKEKEAASAAVAPSSSSSSTASKSSSTSAKSSSPAGKIKSSSNGVAKTK